MKIHYLPRLSPNGCDHALIVASNGDATVMSTEPNGDVRVRAIDRHERAEMRAAFRGVWARRSEVIVAE